MRVKSKKRTVYSMLIPVIVAVIAGLSMVLILFITKNQSPTQPLYPIEQKRGNSTEIDTRVTNEPDAPQTGVSDSSINTTDENAGAAAFPTTKPNLSVSIIGYKVNRDIITVETRILPQASGQCSIELTRSGLATFRQVSALQNTADSSFCSNEEINISSASRGVWDLTVRVQAGSNIATSTVPISIK